jgi:succinate dehydrogenase / fumarate reductase cytochrome b subunit
MTKVAGEVSTASQREDADAAERLARQTGAPIPTPRQPPFIITFYRSAIAKKWLMAISGIVLLGYVLAHMLGNLKVFLGKSDINDYADWLRSLGEPAFPRTVVLWTLRTVLISAFAIHILAAYQLTRMNQRARQPYRSPRDYAAADFASRTMRWTGVIVGLFVIFHLLDLTWGTAGSHWVRGDPYDNMIHSFQRVPVAIAYIVANVALGIHIFHGAWSMFQSLGLNNPRYNAWRRYFAVGFAGLITTGNVAMPLLITTKVHP